MARFERIFLAFGLMLLAVWGIPRPGTIPSLTLVTWFSFQNVGSALKRYIVKTSFWSFNPPKDSSSKVWISTSNKTNQKENEQ